MLYEVAVIGQKLDSREDTLLLPPTPVVADDEKAAIGRVFLDHADKLKGAKSHMEILVRPFVPSVRT